MNRLYWGVIDSDKRELVLKIYWIPFFFLRHLDQPENLLWSSMKYRRRYASSFWVRESGFNSMDRLKGYWGRQFHLRNWLILWSSTDGLSWLWCQDERLSAYGARRQSAWGIIVEQHAAARVGPVNTSLKVRPTLYARVATNAMGQWGDEDDVENTTETYLSQKCGRIALEAPTTTSCCLAPFLDENCSWYMTSNP